MVPRGIKLYDHNFTEDDINKVQRGDVIVYNHASALDAYLIVSDIDVAKKRISGHIASAVGVNDVPLEHIVDDKE